MPTAASGVMTTEVPVATLGSDLRSSLFIKLAFDSVRMESETSTFVFADAGVLLKVLFKKAHLPGFAPGFAVDAACCSMDLLWGLGRHSSMR